ncbi:hypothetical protein CB1_000558037 [Camelus ferus]|nr:hypothetical protein CB1_000558037 [Camelus ferus]
MTLAWDHRALWLIVHSCLPRDNDASPCLLGHFCEHRPIGHNLLGNPESEDGFRKRTMLSDGEDWPEEENCQNLIPMAEKIPAPLAGELNLLKFHNWVQVSQLNVNYLKKCLETDVSAHSVKNEVVP